MPGFLFLFLFLQLGRLHYEVMRILRLTRSTGPFEKAVYADDFVVIVHGADKGGELGAQDVCGAAHPVKR